MSSPKAIVQIFIAGTRILSKAFYEAGRQAVKNAKAAPAAAMGEAEGVTNANSGSVTDNLTRQHRMTLDEAQLILNVKRKDEIEQVLKNYEHLFKANSPPQPKADKPPTGKPAPLPTYSHYLQSKVVRARERIQAELEAPAASEVPQQPPQPAVPQSSSTNPSSNAQS